MSQKTDRRNAGLWFVGILSLIFAAIAIWYAKYTDWWTTWINRDQTTVQTINTGASVFVSTASTQPSKPPNTLLPDNQPTSPTSPTSPPPNGNGQRRPQMW